MDRNTIGNEIEAEINASYRYKNLRELSRYTAFSNYSEKQEKGIGRY
ncbi:MAG: hypothetical protein ACLU9V_02290 [Roseburia sp.]